MALNQSEREELFQLRLKARIDARTTACRVKTERASGGLVRVSGYTHYRQTDAFVKKIAGEVFGERNTEFKLRVLSKSAPKFAVVHVPFAGIWRNPDDSNAELLDTQALYGTVLRVYHREGAFVFVQHPDGYVGYLLARELTPVTVEDYLRWKNGAHAITLVPVKAAGITIPPGSRLSRIDGNLLLADGTSAKISKRDVVVFDPSQADFVKAAEKRAEEFVDSPYLWGGKSETGIDCSGFIQTLALQEGIFLPRDASMQCHVGEIVGYLPDYADLLPGDVMFFMNDNAFVFHVGMYLGDHMYMHSASKTGPTKSSVKKDGRNYMNRYGSTFVYARRVHR